ncbi:MAG: leucine-rich repeat domain-containing protein [Treponema sp.]|jgi:hypothetical protein|nr:leucine-rich repeat domain-containing protein [Treponema sp.]
MKTLKCSLFLFVPVILVFSFVAACKSQDTAVQSESSGASAGAAPVNPFYTGDGGKGKSIAILPLQATGLAEDQGYIPALVQGELVSNFKSYSAIDVLDRVQLDNQYAELLSGYYDEDAKEGMDLGHLTPTDYILGGTIIKTSTGYAMQIQITRSADKFTEAPYSGPCTFAELDNLTGVRRASLNLLQKMGIEPTERAKTELAGAAKAQAIAALTADARGYTADKGGRTAEAAIYYTQAAAIDPSMFQTASRASTLTAAIASGSIGAGTRDLLQQHDDWRALLTETEETIYKLIDSVSADPPYTLFYSNDIRWGDINYQTRSRDARFETNLRGNVYWFDSVRTAVQSVYGAVYDGLTKTGHKNEWGLGNWPGSGVTQKNPFSRSWRHEINVVFELVNAQGTAIGRQSYSRRAEYSPRRDGNQISIAHSADDFAAITFSTVKAADISDTGMSIRVASVNGKPPEQTPFQITVIPGAEFVASRILAPRYSQGVIGKGSEKLSGALLIPAEIWGEPVRSIDYLAFSGGTRSEFFSGNSLNGELTSVVIQNGVTSIGDLAFAGNKLTSVTIPDSVIIIDNFAFARNKLTSVVIPDSVTTIGKGAFEWNELTRIVIPNSVTSMGEDVFHSNWKEHAGYQPSSTLTSVTIGANLAITASTSFPDHYYSFVTFYNKNGKKAGTYRFEDGGAPRGPMDWRNWKYYP